MSTSTFSQEIFDIIIDFNAHDWKFLQTLALVNRSWLPSSRLHFFRYAHVNAKNRAQWLELLNSPLASFPQYVRSIGIINNGESLSIKDASQYFIHPKLSNLDELELYNTIINGEMPDVTSLSSLKILRIVQAQVFGSAVPLFSVISALPSLAKLEMRETWVNERESAKVHPLRHPKVPATPRAIALDLDHAILTKEVLKWLNEGSTALTSVDIGQVHPETVEIIGRTLRGNARTLTHLNLDLRRYSGEYDSQEFSSMMNFTSFNALRAIHLHISETEFYSSQWFLGALASIPAPSKDKESGLKLLVLSLGWNVCEDLEEVEVDDESTAEWEDLDRLLSSPRFTSLEELWFIFEKCSQEELTDYITETCLTETGNRGIIFTQEQDCMEKPESWEKIPW